MVQVYQTRFGKEGNCLAACIASLLECPIEDVDWPMPDDLSWHRIWNDKLKDKGLMFIEVPWVEGGILTMTDGCLVLMCGNSKGGLLHSAIGRVDLTEKETKVTCIHDPLGQGCDYLVDLKYIGYLARYFTEQRSQHD